MDEKMKNWNDNTWQIQPELTMPELDPEVVQYALFESDPIEEYRSSLVRNRDKLRKILGQERDSKQQRRIRVAQIFAAWDRLFKSITGDEVYLLFSSKGAKNGELMRLTLISSSAPGGRRWLATKTSSGNGAPRCWCIPIETVVGQRMKIELRKENLLDVAKLYDEVIGGR